ncbi:U3 small nucleolar RNA-associated protein 14 homolog A isoform X2 [Labrus mixtus]|uniref:U3 small nucleolar RNA-associated protein 14 homolog A isoform X2 n=1 Tax=Labrus mixtus TaxID=508554 RepID=UPI0029C0D672|nr:U3 small nucleolar RNA-associated protein 14 homolog A isoform X2 [Labrus mixtus]
MAKVSSKKKLSKTKAKKSSEVADDSAVKKTEVVYDEEEDEEEDLNDNVTSEEEEEDGEDERRRQKLLEAISALGGKRKKTLGERSEAAVQLSEFSVNAEGEGDKINLSDLIGSMDKTPQVSTKTKKQLKTLQKSNRTVQSPLSKQETERIQRDVAFQKAASEVTRWKGIIKQNQRAEQLVFPLNEEPPGPKPMERVVTGWKARTPLEEEIFALLSANKQPIHDPILTPQEEVSMKAMSLEEAKIRRAELQKARALQSYYEAKTRRERKIKSKKYHRVQNKAKRKDFVKQFDEMVKSDPAAALEELNKMELARMQERMSLKHQNSGKWAKSKAIMAKYDEGARKAMQQQLEVNKDLTQKLVTAVNDEEEEEEEEECEGGDPEVLPDFVNDAEQGVDSSNPWMRGKLSEDPAEKETSEIVDLTAEEESADVEEEEEEEEEEVKETEEEALLREFDSRRKRRQAQETDMIPVISLDDDEEEESKTAVEEEEESITAVEEKEESKEEEESKVAAEEEEEQLSEFTNLYKEIAESRREAEAEQAEAAAAADAETSSAQLEETLMRIRTLEDTEELLMQEDSAADEAPVPPPAAEDPPPASQPAGTNKKRKRGIELKQVLTKATKVIRVPLAQTVEDAEDSDDNQEQRGLIREAFAGDDVVSDFLKEKRKQEDAGKPQVVDLTLPGWGEWGGTGLKPSRRKRKKFRMKAAPPPPRKDVSLPGVIISEKRNRSITLHQVNTLPFPFETHTQFESTIRTPLGRTWNTERTVKKMTKPKVVTRMGAIIEPMAREELMKDKNQATVADRNSVNSGKRKR